MATSLPVVNIATATFECTFGRGCDGKCCQNGRPPVDAERAAIIQKHLGKFLPLMRDSARKMVEKQGFLSNRKKVGEPMLRVSDGWCVFFHEGCVLHKVGAAEGDSFQYKPTACALFPLDKLPSGEWFIRQWDFMGEEWDLFCLNPKESTVPAAQALKDELKLAESMEESAVQQPRNRPSDSH